MVQLNWINVNLLVADFVKFNASVQKLSVRKTKKMIHFNWVNVNLLVTRESFYNSLEW